MTQLGFGVVGLKGIGRSHLEALQRTTSARLAAVMDIDAALSGAVGQEFGVQSYADYGDLLADRAVDVVSICTPHLHHAPQAVQAMKAGKMVLCEKPMAVTPADADRMVRASERTGRALGVVFQHRTRAVFRRFRELVAEAGELYRTHMAFTGLRTQAYYQADAWRGTWLKEGGGVLVNQAPHWLDLLQWFFGMPKQVLAWTRTRAHAITVEDQAFVQVEYPSGTVGTWIANTTDVPGVRQVEAYGTKAAVRLRDGVLERAILDPPLDAFLASSTAVWGGPKAQWEPVEVPEVGGGHADVIEAFCQAVMNGREPPVPAAEARKSVELACAVTLSSHAGGTVALPVKRRAYDNLLAKLRRSEIRALEGQTSHKGAETRTK